MNITNGLYRLSYAWWCECIHKFCGFTMYSPEKDCWVWIFPYNNMPISNTTWTCVCFQCSLRIWKTYLMFYTVWSVSNVRSIHHVYPYRYLIPITSKGQVGSPQRSNGVKSEFPELILIYNERSRVIHVAFLHVPNLSLLWWMFGCNGRLLMVRSI